MNLSGQVAGSFTLSKTEKGSLGLTFVGCQIQEDTTSQVLLDLPAANVKISGKSVRVKNGTLAVSAASDGSSEAIKPANSAAKVVLTLVIGTKNYLWQSTSGTVEIKNKGEAGTFNVNAVPAGKLSGNAQQSGGATAPVKVVGSWSYCRPFQAS